MGPILILGTYWNSLVLINQESDKSFTLLLIYDFCLQIYIFKVKSQNTVIERNAYFMARIK